MKKKRFGIPSMLVAVLLTAVLTLVCVRLEVRRTVGEDELALLEGLKLINTRFVGEYEEKDVVDAALSGMVEGLNDRWSYFLDKEDYAATQQRRQNTYVGIGVTVSFEREEGLLVAVVNPGGPAEQAGVRVGELIVSVDGESLAGDTRYQGVELIQGEAGTAVMLGIRDSGGAVRSVEVIRAALETDPVEYELLPDGIGYIQVKNFYLRSADGVKAAVDDLAGQGAWALIFDMRNNGGGYLEQLTDMLDDLLPEGPIFRAMDRGGNEEVTYSDEHCIELPMAVLVNRETYSAAEFFGAELQEWGVGVIVGEETSGKGFSQQTYPLPGDRAVGISTRKYFTGGGVSLIGTGVRLDREVVLSEEAYALQRAGKLSHEEDAQLIAARELLQEFRT